MDPDPPDSLNYPDGIDGPYRSLYKGTTHLIIAGDDFEEPFDGEIEEYECGVEESTIITNSAEMDFIRTRFFNNGYPVPSCYPTDDRDFIGPGPRMRWMPAAERLKLSKEYVQMMLERRQKPVEEPAAQQTRKRKFVECHAGDEEINSAVTTVTDPTSSKYVEMDNVENTEPHSSNPALCLTNSVTIRKKKAALKIPDVMKDYMRNREDFLQTLRPFRGSITAKQAVHVVKQMYADAMCHDDPAGQLRKNYKTFVRDRCVDDADFVQKLTQIVGHMRGFDVSQWSLGDGDAPEELVDTLMDSIDDQNTALNEPKEPPAKKYPKNVAEAGKNIEHEEPPAGSSTATSHLEENVTDHDEAVFKRPFDPPPKKQPKAYLKKSHIQPDVEEPQVQEQSIVDNYVDDGEPPIEEQSVVAHNVQQQEFPIEDELMPDHYKEEEAPVQYQPELGHYLEQEIVQMEYSMLNHHIEQQEDPADGQPTQHSYYQQQPLLYPQFTMNQYGIQQEYPVMDEPMLDHYVVQEDDPEERQPRLDHYNDPEEPLEDRWSGQNVEEQQHHAEEELDAEREGTPVEEESDSEEEEDDDDADDDDDEDGKERKKEEPRMEKQWPVIEQERLPSNYQQRRDPDNEPLNDEDEVLVSDVLSVFIEGYDGVLKEDLLNQDQLLADPYDNDWGPVEQDERLENLQQEPGPSGNALLMERPAEEEAVLDVPEAMNMEPQPAKRRGRPPKKGRRVQQKPPKGPPGRRGRPPKNKAQQLPIAQEEEVVNQDGSYGPDDEYVEEEL